MEIRTNGLALTLELSHPDDEGWMQCDLRVQVPGFSGKFKCQAWRADLVSFRDELTQMVSRIGRPSTAEFTTTEPGIELFLSMNPLGQIQGSYNLENYNSPGQPSLSWKFEMDQTYLAPLLQQIEKCV